MKISVPEIKSIAETLPIGLYAKRRIPIAIVENEETSYYNPISDEIIISSKILQEGMEYIHDPREAETAIRSMLYHEVSHAILTPRKMPMTDWLNIFEDERIETLLRDFYLDTDFKKQVLYVNGFTSISEVPTTASTSMQKFYSTVRFGVGDLDYVDEVYTIINTYSHINALTDRWTYRRYTDAVKELYRKITGEDPPSNASKSIALPAWGGSAEDEEKKPSTPDGKMTATESKEDSTNGADASSKPDHGYTSPLTPDEIAEIVNQIFTTNPYIDTKLTNELELILAKFSRKNNSGAAVAGYSGTFNTRAVTRNDYKYFERSMNINGANTYGTFHLNLFIDVSGSFYRSETEMNKLLRSLSDIERKNKNFKLDVVFCGMGERIVEDRRQRIFKADGGNCLDKEIFNIYRRLQKGNTYNYNIACFDGDACSDGGYNDHGFKAFDHNNCTIISDYDNKRYISKDVATAKVIYTNNYTEELIRNVIDALDKAFR